MLFLKLTLAPAFIGIVTLVGKRWGAGVAGYLTAFPLVSGAILMFLTLEHGPKFGAEAATAALFAVSSSLAFVFVYSWVCLRRSWLSSVSITMAAWILAVKLFVQLPQSALGALILALLLLAIAPRILPRPQRQQSLSSPNGSNVVPRMVAGATLVVCVTSLAEALGPTWSGLLSGFPIMLIVLSAFYHRINGAEFVVTFLRGTLTGFYSSIALCFTLVMALPRMEVLTSLVMAVTASVAVLAGGWFWNNLSQRTSPAAVSDGRKPNA